jgi:hypothetical protein
VTEWDRNNLVVQSLDHYICWFRDIVSNPATSRLFIFRPTIKINLCQNIILWLISFVGSMQMMCEYDRWYVVSLLPVIGTTSDFHKSPDAIF